MLRLIMFLSLGLGTVSAADLDERTPLNKGVQGGAIASSIANNEGEVVEILNAVKQQFSQTHQKTSKDKAMFAFSLVSSVLGTMPFFDLGYDMVPESKGGAVVLGIVSMSPVAIMGTKFTDFILHEIENKICSTPPEELQAVLKTASCPEKSRDGVWSSTVSVVGAISAGPLTYLNHIFWYPRIGLWSLVFDIPTFYVKMIADIWAMRNMASEGLYTVRTYLYPKVLRDRFGGVDSSNRAYLNKQIDDAHKVISELESGSQRVEDLLSATNVQSGDSQKDIYTKLKTLLFPNSYLEQHNEAIEVYDTPKLRRLMQVAGGVLGVFSMAAVEPLAEKGVVETLGAMSLINTTDAGAQNYPGVEAISWLATISAGSLMGFATADSFGKLYDLIASLPSLVSSASAKRSPVVDLDDDKLSRTFKERAHSCITSRGSIATISMLFAIAAAIPNAELSYKYLGTSTPYDRFALFAACTSPLAAYFWAIDEFFLGLKGMYDQRLPLYIKLHMLKNIVNSASADHIHSLVDALQNEGFDSVGRDRV